MTDIQRLKFVCIGVCSTLERHGETEMLSVLRQALSAVHAFESRAEKAERVVAAVKACSAISTEEDYGSEGQDYWKAMQDIRDAIQRAEEASDPRKVTADCPDCNGEGTWQTIHSRETRECRLCGGTGRASPRDEDAG